MSHNHWLIIASLAVALMAGFTGLSLLRNASALAPERRKLQIVLAAIAMGAGIWSMHFVAMLGMRLEVAFYYDALVTLASALVPILVVGAAFLVLHFVKRNTRTIVLSGAMIGLGIVAMHYLGMSGIRLVRAEYPIAGVLVATIVSCAATILAFIAAYGRRTDRNIVLGTLAFGFSVFAAHFVAMAGTRFFAIENAGVPVTWLSNEIMAIGVALASFVISGSFLLTGVNFLPPEVAQASPPTLPRDRPAAESPAAEKTPPPPAHPSLTRNGPLRIPYEKEGRTMFLNSQDAAAIRAEGHYTIVYSKTEKLFSPWSISQMSKRLKDEGFLQTHRSYLVNPDFVSSFERMKDNGVCFFEGVAPIDKVPVSRSHLANVRARLGIDIS